MKHLPVEIFEEFTRGNFTVKKSNRTFSSIGIDQAHEQNNKVVKVDGGAIDILDDVRALLGWAIAGPVISEIVRLVEMLFFHIMRIPEHLKSTFGNTVHSC